MNERELAAELARKGLSFPAAAKLTGMGKNAFYRKMRGESQFRQREMKRLKEILELTDRRISEIFFED